MAQVVYCIPNSLLHKEVIPAWIVIIQGAINSATQPMETHRKEEEGSKQSREGWPKLCEFVSVQVCEAPSTWAETIFYEYLHKDGLIAKTHRASEML